MRSFLHWEKKLRPKLESYSVAALISIFGHHFDISTHVAINHAKVYVQYFCEAFGDIDYWSPLGYYDAAGDNVTGKVWKEIRPPNLVFMLVEACIPLQDLHASFEKKDVLKHQYFLSLPHSYKLFHDASATGKVVATAVNVATIAAASVTPLTAAAAAAATFLRWQQH